MTWWSGSARGVLLAVATLGAVMACGKSASRGLDPVHGAAGKAETLPCTLNGVVHQPGEAFGDCDQCLCRDGTPWCQAIECSPTGGTSGSGAGAGGTAGSGSGTGAGGGSGGTAGGCRLGSATYDEGATWAQDCNTCRCLNSQIECTMALCGAGGLGAIGGGAGTSAAGGAGTSSGGGGSGGVAADAGAGGEAGASNQCGPARVGSLCVIGTPASGSGVDLTVGMTLEVTMQTSGCVLNYCRDELVRVSCDNVIGSGKAYWLSPDICLATDGEHCSTGDCGGVVSASCKPGITLEEGEYTIGIGGDPLSVTFAVPGNYQASDLCAPPPT